MSPGITYIIFHAQSSHNPAQIQGERHRLQFKGRKYQRICGHDLKQPQGVPLSPRVCGRGHRLVLLVTLDHLWTNYHQHMGVVSVLSGQSRV